MKNYNKDLRVENDNTIKRVNFSNKYCNNKGIRLFKDLDIKRIIILLGISVIIIIASLISIYIQNNNLKININNNKLENKKGKIAVYISGAINNPGVYYFNENTKINDALNIIGGITVDADLNKVNLAKTLYDSEKIIIPYKDEKKEEIEKEETDKEETDSNLESKDSNNKDKSDEKIININTDELRVLMTLPGVGEITAKKIIEYRKENRFEKIEDIKKVSGIGEVKFNKMKDMIVVN